MSEVLHFQIQSPENFLRLACTIRFQKNKKNLDRVEYAWQTLLDTDAGVLCSVYQTRTEVIVADAYDSTKIYQITSSEFYHALDDKEVIHNGKIKDEVN